MGAAALIVLGRRHASADDAIGLPHNNNIKEPAMADHPHSKIIITIGGLVIFALVLIAATFGMGEWKSTPPITATAPLPPASVTR